MTKSDYVLFLRICKIYTNSMIQIREIFKITMVENTTYFYTVLDLVGLEYVRIKTGYKSQSTMISKCKVVETSFFFNFSFFVISP